MYSSKIRATICRAVAGIALCALVTACSATTPAGISVAPRPADATLKITAPASNGLLGGGSVKVSVTYNGPLLVPGAEARKLDDYHLHYFLDEDAAAYVSGARSIPAGNPRIVHSAAREVTFDKVEAGTHTVSVVMSGNNHVPVSPALIDTVAFTVQ
jgi:hypothetical protein